MVDLEEVARRGGRLWWGVSFERGGADGGDGGLEAGGVGVRMGEVREEVAGRGWAVGDEGEDLGD